MWLKRLQKLDFFTLALLGSAFLHLLIIAFVKFQPPALQFFKDQMSALDVVLVAVSEDVNDSEMVPVTLLTVELVRD